MTRTRIASVGYLNARPLTGDLDRGRYEVLEDHPSAIARHLADGKVDVALVPVASVLNDPALRIVPGVAIGSDGPVSSVLLVAETPPEQWTRVLLDGASRSSAALARLVLAEGPLSQRVGSVEIVEVPPGEAVPAATGATAALIIGDAARDLPDRLATRVDLAEQWRDWTGLPFVFAVWAGRGDLPAAVVRDLRGAARQGRQRLQDRYDGDDLVYLRDRLRYDLDDRALMGLRRFAALGRRAGLFGTHEVSLYGPAEVVVPRADVDALLARAADGAVLTDDEVRSLHDHARLADLLAAADLRRRAVQPSQGVGWLPMTQKSAAQIASWRASDTAPLAAVQVTASDADALVSAVRAVRERGLDPLVSAREVARLADAAGPGALLRRLSEAGLATVRGSWASYADQPADPGLGACGAGRWLAVAEAAAVQQIPVVGSLLVGLGEDPERRLSHLVRLRRLQERTGSVVGFTLRTPGQAVPDFTRSGTTASEVLRVLALARLVLVGVGHVEVPWATDGEALAQAAAHGGGDDFGPVVLPLEPEGMGEVVAAVERGIREAGGVPVRRDARYRVVGEALSPVRGLRSARSHYQAGA